MSKLSKEQIEIAVNWWADVIENPKFDNGDDSNTGGMAMMLAMLGKSQVTEDQKEAFKIALAKRLESYDMFYHGLTCDYAPCAILGESMVEAGISAQNAPWKTQMSFYDNGVAVSYGYGAESKVLL